MKNKTIAAMVLLLTVSGCVVGPKFRSPAARVPQGYVYSKDTDSVDLAQWWRMFGDRRLDSLMERALDSNRNMASAIKNIEIARLKIASAKASALPSLSLGISAAAQYTPQSKTVQKYGVQPTISWDIDLWGKVVRQAEAAGATYRATFYETAAVRQTLTREVANAYFSAQVYAAALQIARTTYVSRLESERLMDSMFRYGAISEVDLSQASASTATAASTVAQYQRAYEQTILAINLLTNDNPGEVPVEELKVYDITIPAGLPSSLLERRPDVMQAYYGVQSANAQIGIAIANRLPSISLTAAGGLAATIASDALTGKPIEWSGAVSLLAPILNWGTLKRAEKIARIECEQALLNYEQSVLTAVNDVEQALVGVDTYKKQLVADARVVEKSKIAATLTAELYKAGQSSYLDRLDAERTLLGAQLQYVATLNSLLEAYVTLSTALGGGF